MSTEAIAYLRQQIVRGVLLVLRGYPRAGFAHVRRYATLHRAIARGDRFSARLARGAH